MKFGFVTIIACLGGSHDAGTKDGKNRLFLYNSLTEIEQDWKDDLDEHMEQVARGERTAGEVVNPATEMDVRFALQLDDGITMVYASSANNQSQRVEYVHYPIADIVDILWEAEYFARKCDVTGLPMNEGWLFNDSEFYAINEQACVVIARRVYNQSPTAMFHDDTLFKTDWEDPAERYLIATSRGDIWDSEDQFVQITSPQISSIIPRRIAI